MDYAKTRALLANTKAQQTELKSNLQSIENALNE